jgi:hypothetical protein
MQNLSGTGSGSDAFPNYSDYVSSLVDLVAAAIFGYEAMIPNVGSNGFGVVQPHLRAPLHGFVARSWEALRNTHQSSKSRLPTLEVTAEEKLKGENFYHYIILVR